MSTESIAIEGELLPPVEAGHIVAFNATEAGLAELREQLAGKTFDCTDKAQDTEARQARRQLVTLRTTIEARRKELKAPLLERGKKLDDEAKRITGEILTLEAPIDAAIKGEEERKAAERAAREKAEAERRAAVMAVIDHLAQRPLALVNADSHTIALMQMELAEPVRLPEAATAMEAERAEVTRQDVLAKLDQLYRLTLAREAESARLAEERRALQAEQEAAAARQREADEAARREREAEQARLDEARRVEQARIDAENAAERERLAEQQRTLDAERAEMQRQRDEQAAREREAEAQRQREAAVAEAERLRAEAERLAALDAERRAALTLRVAAQAVADYWLGGAHDATRMDELVSDLSAVLEREQVAA